MGRSAPVIEDDVLNAEDLVLLHEGKILLSRITTRVEVQVRRDGVDVDIVRDYTRKLEDPDEDLDPVDIFTTASEYNQVCALLLSDGFHRITAYKQMNRQTIPARVYRGDELAAFLHALEVNSKHGKSLTNADRIYDVQMILANPETKNWSVRKIAAKVGLSKSTVQNIKNPPAPKPHKPKPEPKVEAAAPAPSPAEEPATKYLPEEPAAAPVSDGPALAPPVVRERQESTLPTKNERLEQLREWVAAGQITRGDVMNIFSGPTGYLTWVRKDLPAGKRSLIIRHAGEVLIEADVRINQELPALLDVEVDDPKTVEYSAAGELVSPFI